MSTSLLYHAFKVRDYSYVKTKYIAGGIVITAERKPQTYRCVACGSQDVGRQGIVTRTFRTLPIGNAPVALEVRIPRLACRSCGVVRQAAIGFAEPRRTYTKAFARYVLDLSRNMTIKAVAQHLGVGWDVVKEVQKKDLRKRFAKPKLKHVKQIAIDEISTGKGHKYVTIVMNLETGAVLHVARAKAAMRCCLSGSDFTPRAPRSKPWPPTCRRPISPLWPSICHMRRWSSIGFM